MCDIGHILLNESRVNIVQYLECDISYSVKMYHTVAVQHLKDFFYFILFYYYYYFFFFIAQKVSNIHLVTKDYKIVPLTNLLGLLLAGRVVGGVCLVRLILVQQ
jgi:hypothetical protein